jgi:hypothetical protein
MKRPLSGSSAGTESASTLPSACAVTARSWSSSTTVVDTSRPVAMASRRAAATRPNITLAGVGATCAR